MSETKGWQPHGHQTCAPSAKMDHWVGIITKRFDAGVQRQHRTQKYYKWTKALLGTHGFLFTFLLNFLNLQILTTYQYFSNRLQRTYVKIQLCVISIKRDFSMNISSIYQMYINHKSERNKVHYYNIISVTLCFAESFVKTMTSFTKNKMKR